MILQLVDLAHDGFREHQVFLRQLDMGQIVILALREGLIPGFTGRGLQLGFGPRKIALVHPANRGVHGVLGAAAVDPDHFQLHIQRPLVEIQRRPWMAHVKAKFLGFDAALGSWVDIIWLIVRIAMVAGIDDQDIARFDFHLALDHFRGIDAVIGHQVRNIGDHAWPDRSLNGISAMARAPEWKARSPTRWVPTVLLQFRICPFAP